MRESAMFHVGPCMPFVVVRVARIDDHEPFGCGKQSTHIALEYAVLDEMVDDVERQREIRGLTLVLVGDFEHLGGVSGEFPVALIDGGLAYIETHVVRVSCERQLIAVATAELDDAFYLPLAHKGVDQFGLERGELTVRADAGV